MNEIDATERRKQLMIDYRMTFNSEAGQRILKDLQEFCGFNQPCFYRGESDMTAFTLGMRNVFLRIKLFLERDLEEKLQKEAIDDE